MPALLTQRQEDLCVWSLSDLHSESQHGQRDLVSILEDGEESLTFRLKTLYALGWKDEAESDTKWALAGTNSLKNSKSQKTNKQTKNKKQKTKQNTTLAFSFKFRQKRACIFGTWPKLPWRIGSSKQWQSNVPSENCPQASTRRFAHSGLMGWFVLWALQTSR